MKRFAESSLLRQADGKPEIIREVLGDWVSPHMTLSDTLQSYEMAPPEGLTLYGTASHYRVVKYLAGIARYLDRPQEAERMDAWAARIAESFNREFSIRLRRPITGISRLRTARRRTSFRSNTGSFLRATGTRYSGT